MRGVEGSGFGKFRLKANGLLIGELSSADHVFSSLSLPTPPASAEGPGAAPAFTYAGAPPGPSCDLQPVVATELVVTVSWELDTFS